MIDFDRANSIGLGYVTSWVTGGQMMGNEYKALNPTRADNKIGSFSINMTNGLWSDFADFNEAKGDVVALYAYLFRNELRGSTEQQIQCEAAKAILSKYDGQIFENTNYKKESNSSPWAKYHQLTAGTEKLPEFDVSWHEKNSAKKPFEKFWDFKNKRGFTVLRIARFRDQDGKVDKPFTLWRAGTVTKWRSITLQGKTPLYNLKGLMEQEAHPVLLTEGQKNAEDSREILINHFVTTAIYGKPEKMDLEPLRGRKVFLWRDPDKAGRDKVSKLKKILLEMDCIVFIVDSPEKKAKWDISDAIQEGWSVQRLVDHIKKVEIEPEEEEEFFLDDGYPFKIVAVAPGYIYIYNPRNKLVENIRTNSLGKGSLMPLMDLNLWRTAHPGVKEGTVDWDEAANTMLKISESCPLWDPSLVRGAGVWRDVGGKIICSTGENLIIDNQKVKLMDFDSKYVYKRTKLAPYQHENPMSKKESSSFLDLFKLVEFEHEIHKIYLAGWAFLAPFCGILEWRPHIWLTGGAGSGKSHVQQKIISKLMEGFAETVYSNGTTVAGIYQRLANSGKPVIADEAESNDKKSDEMIQLFLTIARQSSTGGMNSPEILKGSQDGLGASFKANSMFFFASILDSVKHGADVRRIEVLELKKPSEDKKQVQERKARYGKLLELEEEILSPEFRQRFYARALNILEETLKAVEIFISLSADILCSQSGGDQKGTLLAGAYMISHDKAPTKQEALSWTKSMDLQGTKDFDSSKPDEERCLDVIMSYHVEVISLDYRAKKTIGMWIEEVQKKPLEAEYITNTLRGYGIRVNAGSFDIACNYEYIKKILRETPWNSTYAKLLKRHKDVMQAPKTCRFNGSTKGIVRIKVEDQDDSPY